MNSQTFLAGACAASALVTAFAFSQSADYVRMHAVTTPHQAKLVAAKERLSGLQTLAQEDDVGRLAGIAKKLRSKIHETL